jgi:hypothetical protein
MATKTTRTRPRKATTKRPARQQQPGEAVVLPTDPASGRLQAELDDLQAPGRVSKTDAEQIDNSPGYSKDQLLHMREYYGLKESTAAVAEV